MCTQPLDIEQPWPLAGPGWKIREGHSHRLGLAFPRDGPLVNHTLAKGGSREEKGEGRSGGFRAVHYRRSAYLASLLWNCLASFPLVKDRWKSTAVGAGGRTSWSVAERIAFQE